MSLSKKAKASSNCLFCFAVQDDPELRIELDAIYISDEEFRIQRSSVYTRVKGGRWRPKKLKESKKGTKLGKQRVASVKGGTLKSRGWYRQHIAMPAPYIQEEKVVGWCKLANIFFFS